MRTQCDLNDDDNTALPAGAMQYRRAVRHVYDIKDSVTGEYREMACRAHVDVVMGVQQLLLQAEDAKALRLREWCAKYRNNADEDIAQKI